MSALAYPPLQMPSEHPPRRPMILPPRLDADCLVNFLPVRGPKWLDRSRRSNHGTISGATWTSKGRRGPGLLFDASNDEVTTGSDPLGVHAVAVEVWFYPTTWGEFNFEGGICGNGSRILMLETINDKVAFGSSYWDTVGSANNSIKLNKWWHVVANQTAAGVVNLFVNGTHSGATDQDGGTPQAAATAFTIGYDEGTFEHFGGIIDELRVYNRTLTAAEIAMLYEAGRPH